jgi:hypothetical protein
MHVSSLWVGKSKGSKQLKIQIMMEALLLAFFYVCLYDWFRALILVTEKDDLSFPFTTFNYAHCLLSKKNDVCHLPRYLKRHRSEGNLPQRIRRKI